MRHTRKRRPAQADMIREIDDTDSGISEEWDTPFDVAELLDEYPASDDPAHFEHYVDFTAPDVLVDAETGEVVIETGDATVTVGGRRSRHSQRQAVYSPNPTTDSQNSTDRPDTRDGDTGSLHPRNEDWRVHFSDKTNIRVDEGPFAKLYTDTHDNPLAMPLNRRTPPASTVKMNCATEMEAEDLARSLFMAYSLEVEVDGSTLRARGVLNPVALMGEVARFVESSEVENHDLADAAKEVVPEGFAPGEKVALVVDAPEINYVYDPYRPLIASVVRHAGTDGILCENETWGRFYVEAHEIDRAVDIDERTLLASNEGKYTTGSYTDGEDLA